MPPRRTSPYQLRVSPTQPQVGGMDQANWVLWIDTSTEPHSLKCWHPPNEWHFVVGDPAALGGDETLPHLHPELATSDHGHPTLADAAHGHVDLAAATHSHADLSAAFQQALADHAATAHGTQSHPIDSVLHTGASTVLPTAGQKNALAGTQGTPGTTNPYVTTQDSRLSDARTPTTHTHAQADVTNLTTALGGKSDTSHTHAYAATSHTHVDAEIPAAIARDSEVDTKIATHAATPHGGGSGSGPVVVKATAPQTNATTTLATVTNFDIPVAANTDYLLDIAIRYRSSLATAGIKVALLGPAGATVVWDFDAPGTNAAGGTDNQQTFQSQAFGASPVVQSLAVPTINVDWLASVKALISTAGTAGVIQLQFAAEVAATITIQKGTVAVLTS
jgi:hypothetical protein